MEERITSRKNPLLQQVRKLVSSRKARQEAGLFVADGTKLLEEAVKWWRLAAEQGDEKAKEALKSLQNE